MIRGMRPALDAQPQAEPARKPKQDRLADAADKLKAASRLNEAYKGRDCSNPDCPYRAKVLAMREKKAKAQAKWRGGR